MTLNKFFQILSYEEVVFFGKAQRNRKINEAHVNEFLTILAGKTFVPDEDGDMLAFDIMPIVINPNTKHVLDGQHRLDAYKKAIERGLIPEDVKVLVAYWYVYDEAQENLITIMLNSKSKNWSLNDYLRAYAQDIAEYAKLKNFCEKHSLCMKFNKEGAPDPKYRYGAAIITGSGCEKSLKEGSFSFSDDQLALADVIHEEMVQIRQKLGLTKSSSEVEDMAKVWHKQRQLISAKDIVSLKYIPTRVREKQIKGSKDWIEVFAILRDCIDKNRLAVATS